MGFNLHLHAPFACCEVQQIGSVLISFFAKGKGQRRAAVSCKIRHRIAAMNMSQGRVIEAVEERSGTQSTPPTLIFRSEEERTDSLKSPCSLTVAWAMTMVKSAGLSPAFRSHCLLEFVCRPLPARLHGWAQHQADAHNNVGLVGYGVNTHSYIVSGKFYRFKCFLQSRHRYIPCRAK